MNAPIHMPTLKGTVLCKEAWFTEIFSIFLCLLVNRQHKFQIFSKKKIILKYYFDIFIILCKNAQHSKSIP